MDNNLIVIEDSKIEQTQATLTKIREFQGIVKKTLIENIDFGVIPGCKKPSLLKPGAEKIIMLLGVTTEFEIINQHSDIENGFFMYQFKVKLKKDNNIITEGFGSANTKEYKYAKQNAFTIDNTVLKMAKKRALVDAVLLIASLSEVFTQDIEDMGLSKDKDKWTMSEGQRKRLFALQEKAGVSEDGLKDYLMKKFYIRSRTELNDLQYKKLCEDLEKQAKALENKKKEKEAV